MNSLSTESLNPQKEVNKNVKTGLFSCIHQLHEITALLRSEAKLIPGMLSLCAGSLLLLCISSPAAVCARREFEESIWQLQSLSTFSSAPVPKELQVPGRRALWWLWLGYDRVLGLWFVPEGERATAETRGKATSPKAE